MNDPQHVEAYRSLAAAALGSSSDEREQLVRLYRLAVRATPGAGHLELLTRYYGQRREVFGGDDAKTASLLGVGVTPAATTLDRVSLAAMTEVAALVMSSPDAYTVR
jgi:hypothetical protein